MVRIIHKLFLFFLLLMVCKAGASEQIDVFNKLVNQYHAAYNNSDFSLLKSLTVSAEEYEQMIKNIEHNIPDCLTEFDKKFDVNVFQRSFVKSHLYHIKSDTIIIDKISDFKTCSELDIKKISTLVYFKEQNKSVPVTLIILKSVDMKYKILLDIINENYFSNDK